MTSHSWATLKFLILKTFFSMLTFAFAINKAFRSSTLASKLLAIVTMVFDWDCNISNLVMGCSKVGIGGGVTSLDDGPCVSLNIGLRLCVDIGGDWEKKFDVHSTIDWDIFNTFLDACPSVVLSCAGTWLDCRVALSVPCSFDLLVLNSFKHSHCYLSNF